MDSIYADSKFETLRPDFPSINTSDADNHQPDIERAIRTVKDRVRSTYQMLPFKYIPCLMVIHLVRNTISWLNAFPTENGWSSKHAPRYIMTGKQLDYNKHVQAEFGEYVQTHEEHDLDMYEQTVRAICMGPTGNQKGGHHFMSVATGECLVRSRWTPLPMPREAQTRVKNFESKQKMPKSLTFGDRHGQLDEVEEWSDEDDDTYEYDDNVDDHELSFDVVEDVVEDSIVDIPNEGPPTDQPSEVLPTDQTDDVGAPLIQPPITNDHNNGENTGVEDIAPMADAIHSADLMEDDHEAAGQITGVEESLNEDDVSDRMVDC